MIHLKRINIKILLTAIFILSYCSFSQPYGKYLPHGFKSYIVNYNAIKGDPFLIDFSARQFVMIDEQGYNEGKSIIKIKPDMPVLKYRCLVSSYPSFFKYYEILDMDERCFMHSCDPAGLWASKSGDSILLSWFNDRRYLNNYGYRIYISNDTSKGYLFNEIKQNNIKINLKNLENKYISIYTLKTMSGPEALFSFPLKIIASSLPKTNHIFNSIYTAGYNSTRDSLIINILPDSPLDSVFLQIDLNHDRKISANEVFLFNKNAFSQNISYSFARADYNAGTGFRILIKHDKTIDTLPSGKYFYTTNINNRVRSNPYGNELMDPVSKTWQDYTVEAISESFTAGNYNGVFTDNTTLGVQSWMYEVPPPLFAYSEQVWNEGMVTFLEKIRAVSGKFPVFFNGNVQGVNSGILLKPCDGGMYEGWGYSHWAGYASESGWISAQNQVLITRNIFHKIFLTLGGTQADDLDARIFVFSSFLLTADDSVWYANAESYQSFAHLPEMNLDLGKPLKSAINNISELKESNGLYIRRFEKGIAIVNPSQNAISLPSSLPDNQIKVTKGNTPNGSRIFTQKILLQSLASKRGLILMYEPVSSPEVKNVIFNPLNPTDGKKNTVRSKISGSGPLYAELWVSGIISKLKLHDDGNDGDEVKGDSVYSASFNILPGMNSNAKNIKIGVYDTNGLAYIYNDTIEVSPSDSINLVPNYSYEFDTDNNLVPDGWSSYVNGFNYDTSGLYNKTGKKSIRLLSTDSTLSFGVYTKIILNQKAPADLVLSGWSKANNVTGALNNDYSLYVDAYYNDGTPLYGQCAKFNTGTHDWQYSEYRIKPAKPITSLNLYCLFRKHRGEVWYDQISLKELSKVDVEKNNDIFTQGITGIFPNPFNSSVMIKYSVKENGKVNLKIYNILGQEVLTLFEGWQGADTYSLLWNSKDKNQNKCSSGIYFCRFSIDGKLIQNSKLLLLK